MQVLLKITLDKNIEFNREKSRKNIKTPDKTKNNFSPGNNNFYIRTSFKNVKEYSDKIYFSSG